MLNSLSDRFEVVHTDGLPDENALEKCDLDKVKLFKNLMVYFQLST